jgi:hypothetical protein
MKRRDFISTASLAVAGSLSALDVFSQVLVPRRAGAGPAAIPTAINQDFIELLKWCSEKGWLDYLRQTTGFMLPGGFDTGSLGTSRAAHEFFFASIPGLQKPDGFSDFKGSQLISEGDPAGSLLYHALASPRVRPSGVSAYPEPSQLDALENYIYAWHPFDPGHLEAGVTYVVGVFAYQYRPAPKTPHGRHADLVFSRTGIARVGETPMHYDAEKRCWTNKPASGDAKKIAVTPARYGLFLAKKIGQGDLAKMGTGRFKHRGGTADRFDDRNDEARQFFLPIRKLFAGDTLLAGAVFSFTEEHTSQKLSGLFSSLMGQDLQAAPYVRGSADLILSGSETALGSSFLLCAIPQQLIRPAVDAARRPVQITIPRRQGRYFTTLETAKQEVIEIFNGADRGPNLYVKGRNVPLYLNIRYPRDASGQALPHLSGASQPTVEDQITKSYPVSLFEDSICDGCISVNASNLGGTWLHGLVKQCQPAFSIVTAPDFFPMVDTFDLMAYDIDPGTGTDSNFLEGGLANLASGRIRPDPSRHKPGSADIAFPSADNKDPLATTITAVVSGKPGQMRPAVQVDYAPLTYLPDACSSVYAPGWDVTFGGTDRAPDSVYLTTKGLGSPFPEDMKLCAAMNGMWAVASPDAARTFQGSVVDRDLDDYNRNPTSIPLLDPEIGYHLNSPYNDGRAVRQETFGWDGEQGPFLFRDTDGTLKVNFTDLGRADYVANVLSNGSDPAFQGFDMSLLRELDARELIARMDCLRRCIRKIAGDDGASPALTQLWLISAETANWGTAPLNGFGVPAKLVGTDKQWLTPPAQARVHGKGYLFIFAMTIKDHKFNNIDWDLQSANVKRRRQRCTSVMVCQTVPGQEPVITETIDGTVDWR